MSLNLSRGRRAPFHDIETQSPDNESQADSPALLAFCVYRRRRVRKQRAQFLGLNTNLSETEAQRTSLPALHTLNPLLLVNPRNSVYLYPNMARAWDT